MKIDLSGIGIEDEAPDSITLIYQFRDEIPENKDDLDSYLRLYYGFHLASVPIDDGNSSPLDFVWHIFSVAMGLKPNPSLEDYNILGMSARNSQKSLSCAAFELLALTFDQDRNYFHMASIYEQSRVTYGYVQAALERTIMKGVVRKTIMRETISRYRKILKIGTGTIKNVNSFHGSVLADEVDLTDRKVFVESKGMLAPGGYGKGALDVKISSRKYAFGNIQSLLNEKAKNPNYPLLIHKWGQLEVTEKCPTSRSITEEKTVPIFVDEEHLKAISTEEFNNIRDVGDREKYEKMMGFPGCLPCGIFSFCKTNLKKQTTDNPYLVPIDEVRRLFFTDDIEFFKSQRLNRKPSQSGLIYGQWNPFKQSLSLEGLYEVFTGKEWESEDPLTKEELLKIMFDAGCRAYLGVDYGFNVAVALLILRDGSGRSYIMDQVLAETKSDASFARMCWDRWKNLSITRGFGDVASPGGIQEFAQYFPMLETVLSGKSDTSYKEYAKLSKNYDYRFGLIRKLISTPGTNLPLLFAYSGVSEISDYIGIYRYHVDAKTDTIMPYPADGQRDHGMDALAHGLVGIDVAGGGATQMVVANNQPMPSDERVTAPTPEELALLDNTVISGSGGSMPSRSVAINPQTGLPLEPEKLQDKEKEPRGNKKFRFTFT